MHGIYMKYYDEYHDLGLQAPLSEADIRDFWMGAESLNPRLSTNHARAAFEALSRYLTILGEEISPFCSTPLLRVNTILGMAREK